MISQVAGGHKKPRRFGAGVSQPMPMAASGERIPEIVEWFSGLSVDDRVLSLTMVDDFFANSIHRMQTKINKHGQGYFKFQQRVVTHTIQKGPLQARE